mmetsp:Transcript_31952/g.80019  ORF Transcript_31952/g.80019 Transcript_31952/m.80019 type:complete len:260 (-) Transcript_31952:220-999(-)
MAPTPTLLLVAEPLAAPDTLAALQQVLGGLEGVSVATGSGALLDRGALQAAAGAPYAAVWSVSATAGFHSTARLAALAAAVAPGGQLRVQEPKQSEDALRKALMFSGFQEAETAGALSDGAVAVAAKKPSWEAGVKQPLKKRPEAAPGKKVWTLAEDDEDEEEMIDDEHLLTEDDLKRPEAPANDDCEVGKGGKKACKNCTCGRAEGAMPTQEQLDNPQSACGSCGLGDAFRCGTCPYRGLPAFKPGEKITLPTNVVDV